MTGSFIVAYHGSPYDFDRFDVEKTGTGKRSGALWWGVYFTEGWRTAEYYKTIRAHPDRTQIETEDGILYRVRIHAEPEAFMDLEKPLRGQPDAVKEFVRSELGGMHPGSDMERMMIPTLYRIGQREVSNRLVRAGVPGAKFILPSALEVGDTNARNWIVFDPNIVQITHKNDIAVDVEPRT
jgi:hypothetical protein